MKRNDNKEFQSQVIFSPKTLSSLKVKLVTKKSLLNPKCPVSDVSTSIDALMRIDRLFFLSSTSTWSARVKCPLSSKMLQSHSFTPKCT
ncbi:hypothetical protein IGI04_002380 [Brassica rapa subsp. trilocularis]|uniref:Uncharacterized protein n=1 Tax=Brassica rapa subsp. trilocularis TaxID=1813537 RepID=A0ABQ7NVD7_BRACM|nr:hypothetical protein IGI04_002380 [Brassica rapa subsp. trilocularis]